jgi:hypothetical protein
MTAVRRRRARCATVVRLSDYRDGPLASVNAQLRLVWPRPARAALSAGEIAHRARMLDHLERRASGSRERGGNP